MDQLQVDGYTILRNVSSRADCERFAADVEAALQTQSDAAIAGAGGGVVGGRNLLALWDGWKPLIGRPEVAELIRHEVGPEAGLVRALYFDKPPGKGWSLALHRDKTIAVAEHCDPPGPFSKPTRKAGVPHVEATEELLRRMLTLRLHLDDMRDENGPLTVIAGSHRDRAATCQADAVTIHCDAGDLFVMRPLLLHGSRAAAPDTRMHRRVIHLEIAPESQLPGHYQWHQFEPVDGSARCDHSGW